jgi:hypothetical protein
MAVSFNGGGNWNLDTNKLLQKESEEKEAEEEENKIENEEEGTYLL